LPLSLPSPFFIRGEMTQARTARRTPRDANKLLPQDQAAHRWFRFVLSFPPHLVRDYVRKFRLSSEDCVLDPFCGTGTTIVECKKLGVPAIGVEAHPLAHFASSVKVDWSCQPEGLLKHARMVADSASRQLLSEGIEDNPVLEPDWRDFDKLRRLPSDAADLLLKGSISPLPLHKTLVLLECLEAQRNDCYYGHERLAAARAIVFSISNLEFGPEVGVGKPRRDAPVVASWLQEVGAIAEDLKQLKDLPPVRAVVHNADARELSRVLEPASIDAVITSPPYPNEKDYTRSTRLESVLLGFIKNKAELRELKRLLVRSNTRGVYKGDDDDRWIQEHEAIHRIAEAIEARRLALRKNSGFERLYPRVTKLYFGGMWRHFKDLRKVLRPGARLAYVVGDQASYLQVMIRTGTLIADIARSLGYEVLGIDLFRTRLATATKEQLREEVVLLRWPG